LNNPYGDLFNQILKEKKVRDKEILIKYIDSIDELKFTNILYIPVSNSRKLEDILVKTKNKNILTVSDIRGFADKKGIVQIYFVSQKVKMKINLDSATQNKLKISLSLLRIADVIKEDTL